jgi:hypothetical protein
LALGDGVSTLPLTETNEQQVGDGYNGGAVHVLRQTAYEKSLDLLLNFAVSLKLL